MRKVIGLCAGAFSVMALSNAIVPHLPYFAGGSAAQGIVYSAYFFGAFIFTLPAGILSDRIGPRPLVLMGLVITLASGFLLLSSGGSTIATFARLLEGVGAGLFVTAALAVVNQDRIHRRFSGYFMAMLNAGLIAGVAGTGLLVSWTGDEVVGISVFTACTIPPLITCLLSPRSILKTVRTAQRAVTDSMLSLHVELARTFHSYFWLWFSSVILTGLTGTVIALYPEYSGVGPDVIGIQVAAMNLATIIALLLFAHVHIDPIRAVRAGAAFEGTGAVLALWTPLSLLSMVVIGAAAGAATIAQLNYLAVHEVQQGTVIGLFTMASYGGMALLPALSGIMAQFVSFPVAFGLNAILAVIVVLTIGRSETSFREKPQ